MKFAQNCFFLKTAALCWLPQETEDSGVLVGVGEVKLAENGGDSFSNTTLCIFSERGSLPGG